MDLPSLGDKTVPLQSSPAGSTWVLLDELPEACSTAEAGFDTCDVTCDTFDKKSQPDSELEVLLTAKVKSL